VGTVPLGDESSQPVDCMIAPIEIGAPVPYRDLRRARAVDGERRSLRRVLFDPTLDWTAELATASQTLECRVLDLHCFGARLWAPLRGMRLVGAHCWLPGVGQVTGDLLITGAHFVHEHERLRFRVTATIPGQDGQLLKQFLAFGHRKGDESAEPSYTIDRLRESRIAGVALRVEAVSSTSDYHAVLDLRHRAYAAADIVGPECRSCELGDEFDRRSLIFVARVNGVVIGTGRLIFCHEADDRFLCEKDIPFSALGSHRRTDFVEVSRLAVETALRKSDVMSALVKAFARHAILSGRSGVCLARTSQRGSYAKYGFELASYEIPHPRLAEQTLALMVWRPERFLEGSFAASEAQKRLVAEVRETVAYAGLERAPSRAARVCSVNCGQADLAPLAGRFVGD